MNNNELAKKIAENYTAKTESKTDRLIALDKAVKTPAQILAYTLGILGTLILGTGMCLAMQIIATGTLWIVVGVIVGIVGIAVVSLNYFIYRAVLATRKAKYSEEILSLASEILSEN